MTNEGTGSNADRAASSLNDINTRVRFFDNQFLRAQDLIDEQRYHMDRQRRLLKHLYTPGIVSGLEVHTVSGGLRVTKGTALDGEGRQLVLTNEPTISVGSGASGALVIAFQEAYGQILSQDGQSIRWSEEPAVSFVTGDVPAGAVVLARFDGVRPTPGPYAGLRLRGPLSVGEALGGGLPEPGGAQVAGKLDVMGRTTLSNGLTVEQEAVLQGKLRVGSTAMPQATLDITGSLAVSGASTLGTLTVLQDSILQTKLRVGSTAMPQATLDITGSLAVSGAATLGTLTVLQDGILQTKLRVGSTATPQATLDVAGGLAVSGQATINNGLTVQTANASNPALVVTGAATLNGTVSVAKPAIQEGTNDYQLEIYAPPGGNTANYTKIRFHQHGQNWGWLGYHGIQANAEGEFVFWDLNKAKEARLRTGDLIVGGKQNIIKVETFTRAVQNTNTASPWTISLSNANFSEIYSAFVVLQGFSLFANTSTNFTNFSRVQDAKAIPQHCYVRITSTTLSAITGQCFISESGAGETDNTTLFTVVVIGRTNTLP